MDSYTGYPSYFIKYSAPKWPIRESKMFSISYSPAAASPSDKGAGG